MTSPSESRSGGGPMIRDIEIQNFRCFERAKLENCTRINVIVGDNGAGKTAILEAVFLALCSSPPATLKLRQWRGLEGTFMGSPSRIAEAVWGSYFRHMDLSVPIQVRLGGSGPEARSVVISKGYGPTVVPLNDASEAVTSAGMVFEWRDAAGHERRYDAELTPEGIKFGGGGEVLPEFYLYSANHTVSSGELANGFSDLSRRKLQQPFIDLFRREYPWIEDISLEVLAGAPVLHATVSNSPVKLPLNDISGAINRMVGILIAIASREGSCVLVDEIENGIYHKHHLPFWRSILDFSRRMNGQLFMTTHNEEWLEALIEASNGDLQDITFWRVIRGDDDQQPIIRRFAGASLKAAIDTGNEVR